MDILPKLHRYLVKKRIDTIANFAFARLSSKRFILIEYLVSMFIFNIQAIIYFCLSCVYVCLYMKREHVFNIIQSTSVDVLSSMLLPRV